MQQSSLQPCASQMNVLRGLLNRRNAASCARPSLSSAGAPHIARAAPETGTSQASPSAPTSFRHGITHTYYEGNTWSTKFNNTGVQILVDPWLKDDLVFFDQDWLYRGKKVHVNTPKGGKVDINQIVSETDLVVLSQYLDDHLHLPTIEKLPRDIPIVAQPEAAEKLKPYGFKNVTVVDHGQTVEVADGRLRITAAKGASVGPPWSKRQNAYLFQEVVRNSPDGTPGIRLFYEPHCDFVESDVAKLGKVDIVITPVRSTLLGVDPVAYAIVLGDINLKKLIKLLQPKVLIPLENADIAAEGPLAAVVYNRGNLEQVQQMLRDNNFPTRLETPPPVGETIAIAL